MHCEVTCTKREASLIKKKNNTLCHYFSNYSILKNFVSFPVNIWTFKRFFFQKLYILTKSTYTNTSLLLCVFLLCPTLKKIFREKTPLYLFFTLSAAKLNSAGHVYICISTPLFNMQSLSEYKYIFCRQIILIQHCLKA